MPDSTRGSIYISTADEIGEALVDKLGGSGYTPNEWDKSINLCGISDADIPTALENIEDSADGTERGSFEITKANSIASVLNKKFKTTRGFKPKEWASAIDKLTALQVKNASGAIASFSDGADDVPIASASFSIVPYQNLNGYSKPWASGCGKNKLYIPDNVDTTVNDLRLQYSKTTELFTISGTNMNTSSHLLKRWYISSDEIILPTFAIGETYTLFCNNTSLPLYMQFTYKDTNNTTRALGYMQFSTGKVTFTIPNDFNYINDFQLYVNGTATTVNGTFNIWVESGTVSSSSWEPYSNVCPITPYSQMTITKSGVNLWNGGAESGWIDNNGADSPNADRCRSSYISIVGGLSYYFVCGGFSWRIYFYDRSHNFISYIGTYTANRTITAPDNACYLRFALITTEPSGVSVNYPSTKTDAILPKNIQIIVDSFGRSVYGGSRASDGTLSETWESKTFNGSDGENWSAGAVGTYRRTFMSTGLKLTTCLDNLKCDRIEPSNTSENVDRGMTCRSTSYSSNRFYIFVPLTFTEITDLTSFKTWLSNNPVQVCYPPTTPNEYALDPLPEINSYYGDNNIYTDIVDGESSVNYRADIDLSQ